MSEVLIKLDDRKTVSLPVFNQSEATVIAKKEKG